MKILPWIEEDNFNPGYLMRDLDRLPRRGDKPEWRHNQDYWTERGEIPSTDLDGEEFVSTASAAAEPGRRKRGRPLLPEEQACRLSGGSRDTGRRCIQRRLPGVACQYAGAG